MNVTRQDALKAFGGLVGAVGTVTSAVYGGRAEDKVIALQTELKSCSKEACPPALEKNLQYYLITRSVCIGIFGVSFVLLIGCGFYLIWTSWKTGGVAYRALQSCKRRMEYKKLNAATEKVDL